MPSELENLEDIRELDHQLKSHSEPSTPVPKQKNAPEQSPEEDTFTLRPSTQTYDICCQNTKRNYKHPRNTKNRPNKEECKRTTARKTEHTEKFRQPGQ
ncbi:hypothetical protein JTB14_003694 [Gonioctena quinquepunctata]|nr:hypothetical protein JTB14_003694 [Gonioctena quinquepunctata]